ncbi:MAG: triose-phosphate isomerase [Clostridia bacterium]|nr:triose-phosphate isomerase [Clostridia bacterium]
MNNIYFANFKMNLTFAEIEAYVKSLKNLIDLNSNHIGLFVPFTALKQTKDILNGLSILTGAQNVHQEEAGAFTGEINAQMLKECGTDIAIVGHSERRKYFKEKDYEINKKIKQLMKYNIKVVLCIGETKEERTSGNTKKVIYTQLREALAGLYENELDNMIIAYEPVWAIGTGENATNKMIEEVSQIIRQTIKDLYNKNIAEKFPVIYGGSVTVKNIKLLSKIKNINGFLIGGASLNYNTFAEIINEKMKKTANV